MLTRCNSFCIAGNSTYPREADGPSNERLTSHWRFRTPTRLGTTAWRRQSSGAQRHSLAAPSRVVLCGSGSPPVEAARCDGFAGC